MKEATVIGEQEENVSQASSTSQLRKKSTHRRKGGLRRISSTWMKTLFRAALLLTALQLPYLWGKYRNRRDLRSPILLIDDEGKKHTSLSPYTQPSRKLQLAVATLAVVSTSLLIYTASYLYTPESPPSTEDVSSEMTKPLDVSRPTPEVIVPPTPVKPKALSDYTMQELLEKWAKEAVVPDKEVVQERVFMMLEDIRKAIADEENLTSSLFDAIRKADTEAPYAEVEKELVRIVEQLQEGCEKGRNILIEANRIKAAGKEFSYEFWKKVFAVNHDLAAARRDMRFLPHNLGVTAPEYR